MKQLIKIILIFDQLHGYVAIQIFLGLKFFKVVQFGFFFAG